MTAGRSFPSASERSARMNRLTLESENVVVGPVGHAAELHIRLQACRNDETSLCYRSVSALADCPYGYILCSVTELSVAHVL